MPDVRVVILAAGKGTRMESARPKVLHRVAGVPMIQHVLAVAGSLRPKSTTVVVGHQADTLKAALSGQSGLTFVVQEPQLGTAHALLMTEQLLRGVRGTVILLSGDVPLLSAETLQKLLDRHVSTGASATVIMAMVERPSGYGRIVRSGERIARIVEERDASSAERDIHEINSGIYAFTLEGLFEAVKAVATGNAQGEYYLPDLVAIYRARGLGVETLTVSNPDEIRGINSRAELAEVSRIVRQKKNSELMAAGVTIEDPATTFIDGDVEVGADTVIHPGVALEGKVNIGAGTITCNYDGVTKNPTVIEDGAFIGSDSQLVAPVTIGKGAYVGSGATIRENVPAGALAISAGKQRNIEGWVEGKKKKNN